MQISIDIDSPTPIFEQLIEQIKQAVAADRLRPGDPLPSIRQLARDLDVNNKTVAKAYRLLERDSVIQTRGYRGSAIHPDAKAHCSVDLKALAIDRLAQTVDSLRAAGVTDSEIRVAFTELMKRAG